MAQSFPRANVLLTWKWTRTFLSFVSRADGFLTNCPFSTTTTKSLNQPKSDFVAELDRKNRVPASLWLVNRAYNEWSRKFGWLAKCLMAAVPYDDCIGIPISHILPWFNASLAKCLIHESTSRHFVIVKLHVIIADLRLKLYNIPSCTTNWRNFGPAAENVGALKEQRTSEE